MLATGDFNEVFTANERKGGLVVQGVWRSLNVRQQTCVCLTWTSKGGNSPGLEETPVAGSIECLPKQSGL